MVEFKIFPVLETERFILRQLTEQDAEAVYQYFSKPEVVRYYDLDLFTAPSQAIETIARWNSRYAEGRGIRWGIAAKEDDQIIGSCGFFNWSKKDQRAEIGYELDIDHWNKGVMTEVVSTVIKFGFEQLKFNRIEAHFHPDNVASERVLSKVGFKKEGLLREYSLEKGQYRDAVICSILRREF
jgi:ribosomal-protein-alanine N-acetyltransferase